MGELVLVVEDDVDLRDTFVEALHEDVKKFRASARLKKPVPLAELLETVALFCQ